MMNISSFAKLHNLNSKQRKDCILINEVKRFRFLYDRNEMNHKRSRYRRAAWDEIGRKLGMDGIDCMNRWKIIRDRYRKEKKDRVRGLKTVFLKKWLYYDLCTFLDPYLEDVKPFTQELDEVMNEDSQLIEDSSQEGEQMKMESEEQDSPAKKDSFADSDSFAEKDSSAEQDTSAEISSTSLNVSSPPASSTASISVAPFSASTPTTSALMPPSTFIRIVMPTDPPPKVKGTRGGSRRRPKPPPPPKSFPQKYVKILPKTEHPSVRSRRNGMLDDEDGIDLSPYKDKQDVDTVDHLMNFMGNTLKQLPFKKQVKICQELTAVFFNIITEEEEDDDEE